MFKQLLSILNEILATLKSPENPVLYTRKQAIEKTCKDLGGYAFDRIINQAGITPLPIENARYQYFSREDIENIPILLRQRKGTPQPGIKMGGKIGGNGIESIRDQTGRKKIRNPQNSQISAYLADARG